jgi:hypothetical protein
MANLAAIRTKIVRLTIPIVEHLNVGYRAYVYDRELEERLNAFAKHASDELILAAAKIALFLDVVAEWDLKFHEDDPAPIPLTEEALRTVEIDVIDLILDAIRDDRRPKTATSSSSPDG